jgi:trypsin-like peptidase
VVKDEAGAGSGFIASFNGKVYLITNIHVAAGMKQPVFTLLDGTRLIPISAEAAVGHDIMRFGLKTVPAQAIEVGVDLEHTTRIGDEVLVFGNSGGGGVVTSLPGKIVGIGPDRLEVSSAFIPGNSGSPIIHGPTGRVIGIATYLISSRDQFGGGGRIVRRFGFRLDSVRTWEPVNWGGFHAEAEQVEKVSELTADILNFLEALGRKENPALATETLRRPVTEWRQKSNNPRISQADRHAATQSFIASLRSMSRSDVASLEGRLRYSYFRAKLGEERQVREQLYKSFDQLSQTLAMPSTRGF